MNTNGIHYRVKAFLPSSETNKNFSLARLWQKDVKLHSDVSHKISATLDDFIESIVILFLLCFESDDKNRS